MREECTHIITDQTPSLNSGGGGKDKSTVAKGGVGLPILGVVVVIKVKSWYDKVSAEIVHKGERSIVGSGSYVLW